MIVMLSKAFELACVLLILGVSVSFSSCTENHGIKYPIKKCVVDTDGVADDLMALILMLEAERCDNGPKIIAITCVNGVSYLSDAVTNVLKVLHALNRTDIPVYAGADMPLLEQNEKDLSYGHDGFGDFEYPNPPSKDLVRKTHAVNALHHLVKKYPGEVTVLSMAPLTNIALTVRMYPSFLDEVQQLIVMGGSVEGRGNVQPGIDGNSSDDPPANHMVFSSANNTLVTLVYLETTMRARTSMAFRLSLNKFDNIKSWLFKNGERVALKTNEKYWFCPDAVAAIVVTTHGRIVTRSETTYLQAIYEGPTRGMTIADYTNITGKPHNTNLIQDIDQKKYERYIYDYMKC